MALAVTCGGKRLEIMELPGRKHPVMVLTEGGEYLGHAVIKDGVSKDAFIGFFKEAFGHDHEDERD